MFSTIKTYIYGAVVGLFGILSAILVYRGKKIKDQQKVIDKQKQEAKKIKKLNDNKDKVQEFEKQNQVEAEKAKHVEKPINTPDGYYKL